MNSIIKLESRDSSVCMMTGYGLDGRGSTPCMRFFFNPQHLDRLRVHPASYPMGTTDKAAGS
jgi:hypothetical protein